MPSCKLVVRLLNWSRIKTILFWYSNGGRLKIKFSNSAISTELNVDAFWCSMQNLPIRLEGDKKVRKYKPPYYIYLLIIKLMICN